MLNRRSFLKNVGAVTAASIVLPSQLFAMEENKIIGIQLYTIREMVKNDFLGTLKLLSKIGYNSLEAAGYSSGKFYGYSPKEYKKIVSDLELIPMSSHSAFTVDEAQKVIDDTLEAGMKYLIIPWLAPEARKTIDQYKSLAEDYNNIGDLCKRSGLTFGYHNHAFEFEKINGEIPYDVLLKNTDPSLVCMQLDLYWMVYGGFQPEDYFNTYPGRFKLWHIKDMEKSVDRKSTEIGSGIIDFPALLKMREKAGLEQFFVEQESFENGSAEWSIEQSFKYLNSI